MSYECTDSWKGLFTIQSRKQENTRPRKYRSAKKQTARENPKGKKDLMFRLQKNNSFGCVLELFVQIGQ